MPAGAASRRAAEGQQGGGSAPEGVEPHHPKGPRDVFFQTEKPRGSEVREVTGANQSVSMGLPLGDRGGRFATGCCPRAALSMQLQLGFTSTEAGDST